MFGQVFRIVNYESRWGEGPNDKLMLLRTVTLDANGQAVIDMRGIIKPDAIVDFWIMSNTAINNTNAQTFGTAAINIDRGGMGISITAVAAAAPVPAVVIPAANARVTVAIMFDAQWLAESGD